MPVASAKVGRPFRDHRLVVEAIMWRHRKGSPRRDGPRFPLVACSNLAAILFSQNDMAVMLRDR